MSTRNDQPRPMRPSNEVSLHTSSDQPLSEDSQGGVQATAPVATLSGAFETTGNAVRIVRIREDVGE